MGSKVARRELLAHFSLDKRITLGYDSPSNQNTGVFLMKGIGSRIRRIREGLGLNQKQFAPKLGLSRTALGKCEADLSFPNKKVLDILASQYNISMDYLLCNRGTVFYNQNATTDLDGQKIMMDDEMRELFSLMTHSPLVHHSVLSFLQRLKISDQELIAKQLT